MISKQTERILKTRAQLELAENQRLVHQASDCAWCRNSVYSVTTPTCPVMLETITRCRELSRKLSALTATTK